MLAAVPGSGVKDSLNMTPAEPLRIVTFHLNQVGDLLFSLPALASLRAGFPGAHITAVVRPSLTSLLRSSDLVDAIIERARGGLLAKARLIWRLRREKFHIAVSFSQAEECVLLSRFSGAAVRAGFSGGHFASAFTIRTEKAGPPSTMNNLRLVGALGCPVVQNTYVGLVKLDQDDLTQAQELLIKAGVNLDAPLVVLGPGTSHRRTIKEWPSERFAAVADHLATKKSAQAVILGAESDPQIHSAARVPLADLSGRTTLRQAAAILKHAPLFVGVDSGLMHLAAAMATPCVAIFGPSDPNLTGPQ
ncbi:MAG: glycosyltransferase family 9 protein, partial [Verrucomicrobiia bacterium]